MTTRTFLGRGAGFAGRRPLQLSSRLLGSPAGPSERTLAGDREIERTRSLDHVRRPAGRVLDLRAGNGTLSIGAAFAGNDVVAVDLEPEQFSFHTDGVE